MDKMTRVHIWSVLLWSVSALLLAGCGADVLTNTSPIPPSPTALPRVITPSLLQSPTPVPPYIHYTPSKGFNVHLEFDYPGSWVFSEQMQGADFIVIGLGDPRFRTLPTPSLDDLNRTSNDLGGIDIWILPNKLGQTPDSELESLKKDYSETSWMTVLDDYKITLDGHSASVLEYQIKPSEGYSALMFNRRIIFIVKDQIYTILFEVAEKERGGEFEKGYEYFFNSLKILP